MPIGATCNQWLMRLAVMPVLLGASALAFAADGDIVQRFPPGSIASLEAAQRAVEDVASTRAQIEAKYSQEQRQCYDVFFVNRCLGEARERRRAELEPLTPIEVEANRFLRQRKLEERDGELAQKAVEKEARRKQNASAEVEPAANDADKGMRSLANMTPPSTESNERSARELKHEEDLRRRAEAERAGAAKRAERIAAFERKQQEAKARQERVARRKADKESQRENGAAASENGLK